MATDTTILTCARSRSFQFGLVLNKKQKNENKIVENEGNNSQHHMISLGFNVALFVNGETKVDFLFFKLKRTFSLQFATQFYSHKFSLDCNNFLSMNILNISVWHSTKYTRRKYHVAFRRRCNATSKQFYWEINGEICSQIEKRMKND